ncbi:PspC domain-containing protein [Methanosarcina sp. Z-7115]|uniref:PspC domain-containing protein n=1 Tax=Methanosarcina baikalica TaxID=3073890 RepID=A0ABU2CX25_9EURY|nr:PspC domain-containing protein [Methanosarcina sp. Z-7115]MDR7664291.1 PspC domain-containing protein [Methanosarcina sp. Z-7115]
MQENPESQEKKENKEHFFEAPGELRTGYTEESWAKPEEKIEEKEVRTETGEDKGEETGEKEVRTEAGEVKGGESGEEKSTIYTMKRRLTRSKTDRKLFGVCGGLGEYFDIDPTFIRLAFAALVLEGIGIVIYIILAIIMPPEESVEMVSSTRRSNLQR